MEEMRWPSDEIPKHPEKISWRQKTHNLLRFILAFADEALILALIIYLLYKFVYLSAQTT